MEESCRIVVVGAGILGLTAALELQGALFSAKAVRSVTIVAAEFPGDESINYASPWAGAHYRAEPRETENQKLMDVTWGVFREQSRIYPEAGIQFMDAYDYLEDPPVEYINLQGDYSKAENFRLLEKNELPPTVTFGATYTAWCLNPPVYCAFLQRLFLLRGGKTIRSRLTSLSEAATLSPNVKLVVNCSGIGFGDSDVFPIKGQTCLVSNPCDRTITQQNADGTWTFIIPRPLQGGTIIGGTKESEDWSTTASPEIRNRLLVQAAKMHPAILDSNSQFRFIRDIIGRRPARRGGLRLSSEHLDIDAGSPDSRKVKIIHAYGAGGAGYELSWGVAKQVANLAFEDMTLKASL